MVKYKFRSEFISVMLGRIWWLGRYQLLLERLDPLLCPTQLLLGEWGGSRGVDGQPGSVGAA